MNTLAPATTPPNGGRGVRDAGVRAGNRDLLLDLTLDDGSAVTYVLPMLVVPVLVQLLTANLASWETSKAVKVPVINNE